MEGHKCKERTIGSGFIKWNVWTVDTSIMQTAVMLKREDAQIVRVGNHNVNKIFVNYSFIWNNNIDK